MPRCCTRTPARSRAPTRPWTRCRRRPRAFPLVAPPFTVPLLAAAVHERRSFLVAGSADLPAGTKSIWDDALAYALVHPRDPRTAETLYRLIRVARWGGNHNHVGRRAFNVLHTRHAGSSWAKRSPFFYDDQN